jgi:hypothetical protein
VVGHRLNDRINGVSKSAHACISVIASE